MISCTLIQAVLQIPHLVELGINCVELLPVLEYDELEFQRSPNPRDHMVNIWGYSHISFMAPMARFAAGGKGVCPCGQGQECADILHCSWAALLFADVGWRFHVIVHVMQLQQAHTISRSCPSILAAWTIGTCCHGQLCDAGGCASSVATMPSSIRHLQVQQLPGGS